MLHPKIVGTGPIAKIAEDILQPFGEIVIAPEPKLDCLIPLLDEAVALVVRGEGVVNETVIKSAPHLKVIGRSGVGYNNVDIDAATARGIPVVYTPGVGARAVAEAAIAYMLALCKRLDYWNEQLKSGNWISRFDVITGDLDGSTLGIIGFGRIGQTLAQLAKPFDMRLLAHDPFVGPDTAKGLGVRLVKLPELFEQSDFISVHAAATDENRGLINRSLLKKVKPGAYLVNLARGELIESLDILHQALSDGRLAGVALDVFAPEPPDVSHPIFSMANCLTSPHALGMTRRAMVKIFTSMANDMAAVLSGGRPKFVVNPQVFS